MSRFPTEPSVIDYPDPSGEFCRSTEQWEAAVTRARSMRPGEFPKESFDLKGLLVRIPKLPTRIPPEATKIQGYSNWVNLGTNNGCSLRQKREKTQDIHLRARFPIRCTLSLSGNFEIWEGTRNNGIVLLVLAWAYIFNARLAESQGLGLEQQFANSPCAQDLLDTCGPPKCGRLDLSYATADEFAWWKAITTSKAFFSVRGRKECLPWTVAPEQLDGLAIVNARQNGGQQSARKRRWPTARQAAVYLERLCQVYCLGQQSNAALAASISLPSQRSWSPDLSRICLPRPFFGTAPAHPKFKPRYPSGFNALGSYMMLSLTRPAYISCLQSVLWEPGVACNTAGALLRAAHNALEPIIRRKDYELLAKVLSSKMSSPLWLGTALCSRDHGMLVTTKHGDWFGQHAEAAAWTGIHHSFMDTYPPGPHIQDNCISRANVWRLRHDCFREYTRGEDYSNRPSNGWQPYGTMKLQDVDLELQEHLTCSHEWSYSHWTWLFNDGRDPGFRRQSSSNMRRETRRSTGERIPALNSDDANAIQQLSVKAARQTFSWCIEQVEEGFTYVTGPRQIFDKDGTVESGKSAEVPLDRVANWLYATNYIGKLCPPAIQGSSQV